MTDICVVIASFDAAATIPAAVRAALAEREVSEVIVVDDCSHDDTAAAARGADDGSGRLQVIRFVHNQGPSAARNAAIAASRASAIAILDADDRLLPGRFARLLALQNWDIAADNIMFLQEDAVESTAEIAPHQFEPRLRTLDLAAFVLGNIPMRNRPRAELGFLKPVIARAFLDEHALRYDPALRLGEDFILYAHALAQGARFVLTDAVGYVAVERSASLSGQHRTADLAALEQADRHLLAHRQLTAAARAALARHHRSLLAKVRYRRFLDSRRTHGMASALSEAVRAPGGLLTIPRDYLRDKIGRSAPGQQEPRYLFEPAR